MSARSTTRPHPSVRLKCPKCGQGMEIIHGDCRTCCIHYCEKCDITYRYCGGKLDQICPPP
ncbi:MAG: hypothetical protein QXI32_00035 [Candidatus Bathyarchaeia archaeon]